MKNSNFSLYSEKEGKKVRKRIEYYVYVLYIEYYRGY